MSISDQLHRLETRTVCLYCGDQCYKSGKLYMRTREEYVFRAFGDGSGWSFTVDRVERVSDTNIYLHRPPTSLC